MQEQIRWAPAIFGGVVSAVRSRTPDDPTAAIALRDVEVWKGEVPAHPVVASGTSPAMCGAFEETPAIGTRVLILAYPRPGGTDFAFSACAGALYQTESYLPSEIARLWRERSAWNEPTRDGARASPLWLLDRARWHLSWNVADAIADFEAAARLAPHLVPAQIGLGRALIVAGRPAEVATRVRLPSDFAAAQEAAATFAQARFLSGDDSVLATLRDFRNLEADRLDLTGRALADTDFSGARIVQLQAARADLRNARLERAHLGRPAPILSSQVKLEGADLRGAHATGLVLRGADLHEARFDGATLHQSDLSHSSMRGASLRDVDARRADFTGAGLARADLRGARLEGARLDNANLMSADLSGAEVSGASLRGAFYDCRTRFPIGFEPTAFGMSELRVATPEGCPAQ